MSNSTFNIAAVERDTGLSKDVLRMWERRYGFPVPDRDSNGERCYPTEQVERLRVIKRLMDSGHRPGKLLAMPPEALAELAPRRSVPAPQAETPACADELESLIALSFVLGLGLGVSQPMTLSIMARSAPASRLGEATGLRLMLVNGTQTVLPSAFGALGGVIGIGGLFWGMAILLGAGLVGVGRAVRRREG